MLLLIMPFLSFLQSEKSDKKCKIYSVVLQCLCLMLDGKKLLEFCDSFNAVCRHTFVHFTHFTMHFSMVSLWTEGTSVN